MSVVLNKLIELRAMLTAHKRAVQVFFVIFYSVGIVGLSWPAYRELFIGLTPFALFLSFGAILLFHQGGDAFKHIVVFTGIAVVSFFVEVAGVQTQKIFGPYIYGSGLGLKVLETPLMIGLNWVLMVYCGAIIAQKLVSGSFSVLLAATIMIMYDLVLEQVAPLMDMWSWQGDVVPFQNYGAWFVLALIFQVVVKMTHLKMENKIAPTILICQALFFVFIILLFK
jgi:putative membrane protein